MVLRSARVSRSRRWAVGSARASRLASGGWRMADGGGQMADGGGRADDEYEVSLGGCAVGNSSQPMAQAYPDVTAQEDQEPKKAPNKANLESTQASSSQKVESGLTGPAGRKQSQSRDETEIQRREERPAAFRNTHKGRKGPPTIPWCQQGAGPLPRRPSKTLWFESRRRGTLKRRSSGNQAPRLLGHEHRIHAASAIHDPVP